MTQPDDRNLTGSKTKKNKHAREKKTKSQKQRNNKKKQKQKKWTQKDTSNQSHRTTRTKNTNCIGSNMRYENLQSTDQQEPSPSDLKNQQWIKIV